MVFGNITPSSGKLLYGLSLLASLSRECWIMFTCLQFVLQFDNSGNYTAKLVAVELCFVPMLELELMLELLLLLFSDSVSYNAQKK